MTVTTRLGTGLLLATALALLGGAAHAHRDDSVHPPHGREPKSPVRISMKELHEHGGIPPGWRLTVPPGDTAAGRKVFVKLECYKCHVITGGDFPAGVGKRPQDAGPDLTGMGRHHPAEYFLESILNPNAVIVTGPGYTGRDGRSIMPDYRDSLTVADLLDLVAFLKSLTAGHEHPAASGAGHSERESDHRHGGERQPH